MSVEALYTLVPGFKHDKDEDWLPYLSTEKQLFMRTERRQFIKLSDDLETFITSFERKYRKKKNSDDPAIIEKIKRHEEKKAEYSKELKKYAKVLLKRIPDFKKEALETRKRAYEQESESFRKKSRTEDVIDIDDEDMMVDDYLPDFLLEGNKSKELPKETHRTPVRPTQVREPSPQVQEVDSLVDGVDPKDAVILVELRALINKYNCRDRVIKAIHAFRAARRRNKSMHALTTVVAQARVDSANKAGY